MTAFAIRPATVEDIAAMKAIRDGVRENALTSGPIDAPAYATAITVDGRAWVAIVAGEVVGFACGRLPQRDLWAVFVRADHEARGIGSALLATVEDWMFAAGVDQIELATEPGTRAEQLYRRRGWTCEGSLPSGELRFTRTRHEVDPSGAGSHTPGMSGAERRRWKRLEQQLRVQLQILSADTGSHTVHAIGTHLSPAGIFVQLADPPPVGTRVRVIVGGEDTDGALTAEGEVSRQLSLDDESENPPGCGILLDDVGPAWHKLYDLLS
jgi:GNAT superfamily N-acetyltransferase